MPKETEEFICPRKEVLGIFPTSVDINPTARCNLACPICWGPDHQIPDGLDTQQWSGIIRFFAERGTSGIVFTGGEPLLRKDLPELMRVSKSLRMKVTLSTNALLLSKRYAEILPLVDEIGIPLDGSDPKRNGLIRKGTMQAFEASLSALELLASKYPDIHVTMRTVVSRQNKGDIANIGSLLTERSALFDRWKIYQFTPVSIGLARIDDHYISREEFERVVSELNFPELNIMVYPNEQRVGRYVFVGPEGNVFGVDKHGNYQVVANFLNSSEAEVLRGIEEILDPDQNKLRGLG